jgi:hypothetical protein
VAQLEMSIMIGNAFLRWLRQFVLVSRANGVASAPRGQRTKKLRFQPQLEALEDRLVPTTISTPELLRGTYGIDQIRFGASGVVGNGAGQTIALVVIGADDASLVSDLQHFDQVVFGQAGKQLLDTFGNYNGPVSGSATPWFGVVTDPNFPPKTNYSSAEISKHDLETAEDVEWAHAIAPMANILVVQTGSIQSGTGYAGTLQAQNPGWDISVIASSSSHFPSFQAGDYADSSVTYVGITGDTGTSMYSQLEGFGPEDLPASTPNVIAVGGTTLTLNPDGSYGSETGWGFASPNRFLLSTNAIYEPSGTWSSTSGGFSGSYFAAPASSASASATWTTTVTASDILGVNDKGIEISATWTPSMTNADNAQYLVYVDGNLVNTVTVNQQLAPDGTSGTLNSRSATFQELSALSQLVVGDTITVVLSAQGADGTVVADAIGLAPDDASGGGLSDQSQPAFQTGLVIHDGSSTISSGGTRAYPDVAFDGDYINSPVVIVNQGQEQLVAGTSLGAPAWAGLIAIADQGLAMVGHAPLTTAQALAGLYSLPSWDFHDETSGYNGYSAGPGYDLVTGLGSPIANQLIPDLVNTVAPLSGPLTYAAPEGQGPNNIALIQNGSTIEVLNNSTIVAEAPRAETTSIDIIGAQHEFNTLTLDFGPVDNSDHLAAAPTAIPISFDGGTPGGTLILEGGSFTNEVDFASDPHSGTLYLDGAPITYTDLAPIIDTATATNFTIFDPLANDNVTVQNDPNSPENGVPTSQISGNGFEKVDLADKTNVVFIDSTKVGSDTINVVNPLVNNAAFTVEQVPSITNGPATATASVGTAYSFAYTFQGSPAPTFRLLTGSQLPPGLTLSTSGVISGTPTGVGTFTGTVDAANGVGIDATQNYSITVGKAQPTITATAGATVVLGTGARLTATAKLASGFQETGTLTFRLYAPSGLVVDTETVTVSGNGSYGTPHGYLPVVKGTYQWVVIYGGDTDNNGANTVRGRTNEGVIGPGVTVAGTTLYLVGGNTNDGVSIAPIGTSPTGSTGIKVNALLNNVTFKNLTYTQAFREIVVVGLGGNDRIQLASTLTIAALISEANGNDNLQLGNGTYNVTLGNGNNVVTAGTGTINIQGGAGTNRITAGATGSTRNIRIQLGNGAGDQVTLLGNGIDSVQVGNGNNDSVSINGNGNDLIQVGNGTNGAVSMVGNGNDTIKTGSGNGIVHVAGSGTKTLQLGPGWTQV